MSDLILFPTVGWTEPRVKALYIYNSSPEVADLAQPILEANFPDFNSYS